MNFKKISYLILLSVSVLVTSCSSTSSVERYPALKNSSKVTDAFNNWVKDFRQGHKVSGLSVVEYSKKSTPVHNYAQIGEIAGQCESSNQSPQEIIENVVEVIADDNIKGVGKLHVRQVVAAGEYSVIESTFTGVDFSAANNVALIEKLMFVVQNPTVNQLKSWRWCGFLDSMNTTLLRMERIANAGDKITKQRLANFIQYIERVVGHDRYTNDIIAGRDSLKKGKYSVIVVTTNQWPNLFKVGSHTPIFDGDSDFFAFKHSCRLPAGHGDYMDIQSNSYSEALPLTNNLSPREYEGYAYNDKFDVFKYDLNNDFNIVICDIPKIALDDL